MGIFTETKPKCLLPIAGRTLLDHTINQLRSIGCTEIIVVVGHKGEMIDVPNVRLVRNDDYENNNVLHSLMFAQVHLEGPVVVSYSDIWVEPWVFQRLSDTPGDIVLAVDQDWEPYYEGRTKHPISDAENVFFDQSETVVSIGKHLVPAESQSNVCGEFLGLWRMSASGSAKFKQNFESLNSTLQYESPFQQAKQWQKAYITDMFQELIDREEKLDCAVIERGWAELDTDQDYQRLTEIAERQRLITIYEANNK